MFSFAFTERLARLSARYRWLVLGGWLVAVAASLYLAMGIGDLLTTDQSTTVELEADRAERLIAERMGDDEERPELVVIQAQTRTVDDAAYESFVQDLAAGLRTMEDDVAGAITYFDTQDESLVSDDRRSTLMPVVLAGSDEPEEKAKVVRDYVRAHPQAGFAAYVTGEDSISLAFTEIAEADLQTAEVFGLPIALVILAIVFGALVAATIPVVLALLAIVVSVGVSAILAHQFDFSIFIVNVTTMIGLAVGIDYTLFIVERFRDERRAGYEKIDAIGRAGATASRTVLFSGLTVIVALAGMLIIPDSIFRSVATGAIIVVVVAVIAALTLLPAILSLLGDKVNALRIPFTGKRRGSEAEGGFWDRTARLVMAHPVVSVIASVALLLAAATPYLSITLGFAGISTIPSNTDVYKGFAILDSEFTGGLIEPTQIVVDVGDVSAPDIQRAIAGFRARLAGDDAFGASTVTISDAGDLAVVSVPMQGDPQGEEAFKALDRLRTDYVPAAFGDTTAEVSIGGETAGDDDYFELVKQYTPIIFAFVLGLSFIVLLVVFRSIVVPIKALIMNLLSVGAAYGLLVLVFQEGVGTGLLGFTQVDRIEAWVPLFLFAVLFGLSMDYHVFLLSRIRERYDETGDNRESIAFGVRSTASIITGAALIMVAVFAGFAMGDLVMFQQMGFGLAIAVLIDATLVRTVLVPASMVLLGDANWYLPKWLGWLPDMRLDHGAEGARPALHGPEAVAGGE